MDSKDKDNKKNSGWFSFLKGFFLGGHKQKKTSVDIQAEGFCLIFNYV